MSLCHCAVVRYNLITNKSEYETERNEEIATLLFARKFGFSYNNPSAKLNQTEEYEMKIKGNKRLFKILGINYYSNDRKRFSIVC